MARNIPPVSPRTLSADHATVLALQSLSDYQPLNPAYSLAQLLQLQTNLTYAEQNETSAEVALAAARRARSEISHVYHDAVVGARSHVMAQYGPDAAAVALVGMKRKSERRRPVKRHSEAK